MLEEIIRFKIQDLRFKKNFGSQKDLTPNPLLSGEGDQGESDKFIDAIQKAKTCAIIAEVKFASPSSGVIGSKNDLVKKVKAYKNAHVDAISVITEKHFFHGDPEFVRIVKKETSLPILQKDFVIDASQIYEAALLGSDALLLIVRIISLRKLQQFVGLCLRLGIEPVVEINSEDDLQKALKTTTRVIAVNARDLDTFKIDLESACRLLEKIPAKYFRLGFSGVLGKKEFQQYTDAGAQGILIGTTLMRKEDTNEFISSLKTN